MRLLIIERIEAPQGLAGEFVAYGKGEPEKAIIGASARDVVRRFLHQYPEYRGTSVRTGVGVPVGEVLDECEGGEELVVS